MGRHTINDIARLANVSPATVSRVLSGSAGVKPEKRKEVIRIIEETKYQPSSSARSLAMGKSNVIGVIIRDIQNPYYSSLAYFTQKFLFAKGYMTMIISANSQEAIEAEEGQTASVMKICRTFDFAGLMISLPTGNKQLEKELKNFSKPVVLMNRSFGKLLDQVVQNDFHAGYLATLHLIELGYPRILAILGPQESPTCRSRYEGYVQAMTSAGLTVDPAFVFTGDLDTESGYGVGCRVLAGYPDIPRAAFISNVTMALGFMNACNEFHIDIPEMMSIISVDDVSIARHSSIGLSTVGVPIESLAEKAVEVLLERIEGGREDIRGIVLQPKLSPRRTTGKYIEPPFLMDGGAAVPDSE